MKITILMVFATLLAVLSVCLVQAVLSHNKPTIQTARAKRYRVRFKKLNLIERLALPFQRAMQWLFAPRGFYGDSRLVASNIAEGTHTDSANRLTDAAITTRHLLYKKGSDADHIAVAGTTDEAIGTVDDEATAAEENVALQLLGKGPSKRMVASMAIAAGVKVYQAASGKVATTGSRCVGTALTAAAADADVIEVLDTVPAGDRITVTAVAAAGSTVADAGQLAATRVVRISSDGATKGVKLPTGAAGMIIDVINTSATAAELYAATGGTVNGLAANASVVVPASKGLRCYCTAADTWTAFDLTALATAS